MVCNLASANLQSRLVRPRLPGRRSLLRTGASRRGGSGRCRRATFLAAFSTWAVIFSLAAPRSRLFAAMRFFIDRRPCSGGGLLGWDSPLLISLFNVLSLTFLLVGVSGFVASGHGQFLSGKETAEDVQKKCRAMK